MPEREWCLGLGVWNLGLSGCRNLFETIRLRVDEIVSGWIYESGFESNVEAGRELRNSFLDNNNQQK